MNRVYYRLPSRGPALLARRSTHHQPHAVGLADVAEARRLMSGQDGPPLSLRAAAQVVGVLAQDLDRALWATLGGPDA